jgi:hypothetical protein
MRRSQWIGILIAVLAFVGGAIANQALGEVGTNLLHSLLENIAISIETSLWPWSLTLLFVLTTIVSVCFSFILKQARMTADNIVELDDSMTRLFASWLPKVDHTKQMKDLLEELLRDACREFGRYVQRASIMLPDKSNSEYLTIWVSHGMPRETVERVKFYIGQDTHKEGSGGVAGRAYIQQETTVAHITRVRGVWQCDCSGFIRFTSTKHPPAYHTFVCVPIIGPALPSARYNSTSCLGLVCFDSLYETVFDNNHSQRVLRVFARRIAFALKMNELLP